MKADEARALPQEELQSRLDEAIEELFNLRFQNATGQLENYKRIGILKREIARMNTISRERQLGIEPEPAPEESPKRRRRRKAVEEGAPEATEEPAEALEPEEA